MECLKKISRALFSVLLVIGLIPGLAYAAPIADEEPSTHVSAPLDLGDSDANDDSYPITSSTGSEEAVFANDVTKEARDLEAGSQNQEVVIGDTETTNTTYYQPFDFYDKNALSEQIYTTQEIGTGGSIESIAFQISEIEPEKTIDRSLAIYMGHLPASTASLSSAYVAPADFALVCEREGYVPSNEIGWDTIVLDTPFDYNGTDNLAIVVLTSDGSQYSSKLKYKATKTSTSTAIHKGNDNKVYSSIDIALGDSAKSFSSTQDRPNLKLDISVCDHANKTLKQTVAPTCTEEGYTVYHCNDCDKDVKLDKVDPLGHDEQVNVTLAATCEADGSKTTTCKRVGCDYSAIEVIPATGHNWDWEHATIPDADGNTTATCLNDPTHKKTRNIYVNEWEGNAEAWSEGDGTEANPYIIESVANLAYLADQVKNGNAYSGTHFRLGVDLDFKNIPWTPVGVYVPSSSYSGVERAFSGVFDGGNHSISNLAVSSSESGDGISLGLFGMVDGASIRNVNVASGEVKYDSYSSASLGGIVGYAKGTVCIENCHNAASVSGGGRQGGILGKLKEGATLSMSACGNAGDIVTTKSGAEAGGLIGEVSRSYTSQTTVAIQDSCNTGDVEATGSSSHAGGLIGYVNYSALACKASYSNADVMSVNAGGLIGYMGSDSGMKSLEFTSCYAAGTVEGSTSEGGIIGTVNGTMLAQDKAKFVNTAYPMTSGGAIGKNIDAGYFTNCLECDRELCNASSTVALLNTGLDSQEVNGTMTPVFSVGATAPVLYWELDTLPEPATQRAATFTVSPVGSTLALTDTITNQAVAVTKDAAVSSADADVFKATLDPTHDYSLAISKQYYEGQTVAIYASPYQDSYEGSYVLESVFNKEVVIGNPGASSQSYAYYYAPYRAYNKNVVTEEIYTADEINAHASTGSIKNLSFCVDTTGALETDLKIYLGHTTATNTGTSAVSYVEPTELQLVYDGHLTLGQATGWETIEFDQPFAYDHESSLAVIAVRSSTSTSSSLRYKVESTGSTRQVWGRYASSPNYTDLQTALDDAAGTAITASYAAYRPVVRFGINSCTHSEVTAADTKTIAPTCTERGYTATTCPMCNAVISKTYNAEPLGHDLCEEVTLAATCESEGVKHISCTRCDYATDEDISALGHNWDWEHATVLDDKGNVSAGCLNGCGKTKTKNLYVSEWDGSAVAWAAGDGSEANPYQIESAENLAYLAQQVDAGEKYADKHFELTTNLDLKNLPWTPIGSGGSSSTATVFSGTFDGVGHTIANLNISQSSSGSRGYGVFGGISGATIQDLHVISGEISVAVESSYGSGYVAGLVGYTATDSENAIIRCSNAANVAGYTVGGIVGYNNGDVTIEHCKNTGNITSPLSQSGYAGGLVGNQFKAVTMTSCYSTGDVSGANAGGLAGRAGYSATYPFAASNCYVSKMPTGTNVGGLFGRINTSAAGALSASDCYWPGASNGAYGATTNPAEGSITDCAGFDDFMSDEALSKLNAGLGKVTYNDEEMDVFSTFEAGDIDHPILFWEPRVPIEITAPSDSIAFVIDEASPSAATPQTSTIDYNGALELSVSSADDTVATAALITDDEGIITLTVTPVGAGTTVVTITDGKRTLEIQAIVAKVAAKGGSLRMDTSPAGDYSSTSLRMGFAIEMPRGMDASDVSWQWKYGPDGAVDDNLICPGVNYQMDGDTLVTNIVFTGVNAANYEKELAAQLEYTMTFTDEDGQVHTVSSTQPVQTKSVLGVAQAISQNDSATPAEKQYATGILRQSAAARS